MPADRALASVALVGAYFHLHDAGNRQAGTGCTTTLDRNIIMMFVLHLTQGRVDWQMKQIGRRKKRTSSPPLAHSFCDQVCAKSEETLRTLLGGVTKRGHMENVGSVIEWVLHMANRCFQESTFSLLIRSFP
jgi:hypothetical protein